MFFIFRIMMNYRHICISLALFDNFPSVQTVNSEKFECLRYFTKQDKATSHQYLAPDGKPILVETDLRDLGVQLSSNLSFDIHSRIQLQQHPS